MAQIPDFNYLDNVSGWTVSIVDQLTLGRNKFNPLKLNLNRSVNQCSYQNCGTPIRRNRTSGLCDGHTLHQHDLLLELFDSNGISVSVPSHTEIIDQLIAWAKTRNYDLLPLFRDISFAILGNVPDVSTLSSEIVHNGFIPNGLDFYIAQGIECVEKHFPENNNSSYQVLNVKNRNIPARVLALIFVCLIVCEEANRGDRWFWRQIVNDESRTEMLGGAMAIAYFASMSFPWGMEIGKAAPRFTPRG